MKNPVAKALLFAPAVLAASMAFASTSRIVASHLANESVETTASAQTGTVQMASNGAHESGIVGQFGAWIGTIFHDGDDCESGTCAGQQAASNSIAPANAAAPAATIARPVIARPAIAAPANAIARPVIAAPIATAAPAAAASAQPVLIRPAGIARVVTN